MDTEERVRLIMRGVDEVITVEDLRHLFEVENHPKAYIGVEPSGQTLQEYLGFQNISHWMGGLGLESSGLGLSRRRHAHLGGYVAREN